ncbi:MAG: phytanoyl-CoA dioxygenase family protein [Microthrixaceae bacterium]
MPTSLGVGMAQGEAGSPTDTATREPFGRTLKSRSLDDELRVDGYVVLDLLEAAEIRQLIEGWSTIRTSYTPAWDPTGMAVTLRHPGIDHLAHDLIRPVLEPRIQELCSERTGFMSTYLVKKANSGLLPPHLDWRLVNEPQSLTYGCWVALHDMTPETGALGVVPGSHVMVDFDRTPVDPGHDRVDGIVERAGRAETLFVEAGQAVIFDHRLIHFSDPNSSDEDRLAVNFGLSTVEDATVAHDRLVSYMEEGMKGLTVASQLANFDPNSA